MSAPPPNTARKGSQLCDMGLHRRARGRNGADLDFRRPKPAGHFVAAAPRLAAPCLRIRARPFRHYQRRVPRELTPARPHRRGDSSGDHFHRATSSDRSPRLSERVALGPSSAGRSSRRRSTSHCTRSPWHSPMTVLRGARPRTVLSPRGWLAAATAVLAAVVVTQACIQVVIGSRRPSLRRDGLAQVVITLPIVFAIDFILGLGRDPHALGQFGWWDLVHRRGDRCRVRLRSTWPAAAASPDLEPALPLRAGAGRDRRVRPSDRCGVE